MAYDSIIEYYDAGAPLSTSLTRDNARDYKERSKQYKRMLKEEYYDNENPRGVQSLYNILKANNPDDGEHPKRYPPKRFVGDWLRRQGKHQVYRQKKGKAKSIQSVVVSRPNELLQVDYVYFFRNISPSVIVSDEEGLTPAKKAELDKQEADFTKAFGRGKAQYRGAITAIDCFSRYAYVEPIAGPVNSASAKKAMVRIIAAAEKQYDRRVERVQTDKGSEFQKDFRKYMKEMHTKHPGNYRHAYGYEGRSHSQAIVERFNGTFRRMMATVLGKAVITPEWVSKYKKVLRNYNATPHTTLSSKFKKAGSGAPGQRPQDIEKELIAPRDIAADKDQSPTWKQIRANIVDHSIRSNKKQDPVFKVGDYVRIRIFKSDKDTPTFTYKKGPLWEIRRDNGQSSEEFQGVYLITGVRGGKTGKVARAPTYTILARWSKESTPDWFEANQEEDGTIPSSVASPSEESRTIDAEGSIFDGEVYKKPAYPRRFLKEELVRVVQDKKGIPVVNWGETKGGKKKTAADVLDMDEGETLEEYVVEEIKRYVKGSNKKKVVVKWKGYDDTTDEPVTQIDQTEAYEKFLKSKVR